VGTSTRHVELADGLVLGREAVVVFADCLGRDAGESGNDVFGATVEFLDLFN